jgi:predicted DNA-binding transcriptional regulator AlpA
MSPTRLITPADLPRYGITIGNKQRQRLEADGRFPRRVHPTKYTHAYVESEILGMIAACIAERDTAPAAA